MASESKTDSASDWEPDSEQSDQDDNGDDSYDEQSVEESNDKRTTTEHQWQDQASDFRDIPFTGSSGLKVPPPAENKPINYFSLLLDDEFLESLVSDMNSYAKDLFCSRPTTSKNSRINKFKDKTITKEELKVFLALVLHTGTIRLDNLQDYWKKDALFNIPFFRERMSRDRFLHFLRCLNISNPSALKEKRIGCPGLVKKFVDFFNSRMQEVFSPSREICIDEPVLVSNGRVYCRQGVEDRHGMKLYSLNEANGLTVNFLMDCEVPRTNTDHTVNVVMKLMKDFSNKGHSLYTDSFYSGIPLVTQLLANDTYCTGVLNHERKYLPRVVTLAKLATGETVAQYSADGVVVGKWRGYKGTVLYVSTEHANETVYTMNHFGDLGGKPLPITKYNATMKAVDRVEQLLSFYPCQSTSLNWHKKVFIHVLHMITINAFLLFGMANPDSKMSMYDFRLQIIRALLPPAAPRPVAPPAVAPGAHVIALNNKRSHNNKRPGKRCRVCRQAGVRRETVYHCAQCPDRPGLCPVGCFDEFHKAL